MDIGPLDTVVPSDANRLLLYHSHGADTPGAELFSDTDVTTINSLGRQYPTFQGGVISTGQGNLRFYPAGVLPDGIWTPGEIVGHVPAR